MPLPSLETPPNPVETPPTPPKVRTGRYGELEEHELIHLLDSLDDERARARFRESVYISLFVYILLGWFLFYGPRVLFHQPVLVNPSDVLKQREMTNLQLPSDVARELNHAPRTPKPSKAAAAASHQIDRKTLEEMRKAAPAPPAAAAPTPPAPTPPQQAQTTPLPPLPTPRPSAPSPAVIPDAPRPAPNFSQNTAPGDTLRDALRDAAKGRRGSGAESPGGMTPEHVGVGTGVDVLSDTMGVDFDPYLKKIMREIYNTWLPLIPEEARPPLNKQGTTQLRITIMPDGRLHIRDGVHDGLVLEGSSHDDALNRAAWGSITGVGQFPPLPKEFHGPELVLRIHYLVNQRPE